ncbi:MAG: hypothetical protein ABFS18_08045 [Thermodesulfobacteriota bacterium]
MKKIILTVSLLSMFVITLPVWADKKHHPGTKGAPSATQMRMEEMDTSMGKMREMREKVEVEKDSTARQKLMHQHMNMMRDGMNMMTMMGGSSMMGAKDTSSMAMGERMTMMEEKMTMMEKMMSGQGMMMGGTSGKSPNDRMDMMEKKMMMMQEMLTGMMMQQQMMMKKR